MTKSTLLVPATGVAALLLSASLAGCGSGATTVSPTSAANSTSSATSTSASSASSSSTAADTAHYADVTLPELPGWSNDPSIKWLEGNDTYHVAALQYGETATSIQVLIARLKPGQDPVEGAKTLAAAAVADGCQPNGDPAPATMSGFTGYRIEFGCKGGVQQTNIALGIHETAAAPASVVLIAGASLSDNADKVKDALSLITSKGTIVP